MPIAQPRPNRSSLSRRSRRSRSRRAEARACGAHVGRIGASMCRCNARRSPGDAWAALRSRVPSSRLHTRTDLVHCTAHGESSPGGTPARTRCQKSPRYTRRRRRRTDHGLSTPPGMCASRTPRPRSHPGSGSGHLRRSLGPRPLRSCRYTDGGSSRGPRSLQSTHTPRWARSCHDRRTRSGSSPARTLHPTTPRRTGTRRRPSSRRAPSS